VYTHIHRLTAVLAVSSSTLRLHASANTIPLPPCLSDRRDWGEGRGV